MALAAVLGAGCGASAASPPSTAHSVVTTTTAVATATTTAPRPAPPPAKPAPPFAVGERIVAFTDHSRTVRYPGQAPEARKLVTIVRYPAVGPPGLTDATDARPLRAAGPFPLVIFGHGFAVTPAIYAPLLRYWAHAGYVVAAPIFPLGNADAPGGPNENDLVNQPRDMSFVITEMLAANSLPGTVFAGLIDRRRIAVSGQSDGGDTALTVSYDSRFQDRRIGAAVILSGQEIPGVGGYDFPPASPPLLATQGLADTINVPSTTFAFFDAARPPKYLLTMAGAPHLGPYTNLEPQLRVVERVTVAFLDRYVKRARGAGARMSAAGNVPGIAHLRSS